MKKYILLPVFVLLLSGFFTPSTAHAQVVGEPTYEAGCSSIGQCVNNQRCVPVSRVTITGRVTVVAPEGGECGSAQLGGVTPPTSINRYNEYRFGEYSGSVGLVAFLSEILRLFAIVCGIWTMFNFLYSGWLLVSAQADTKAQQEVKERLTMTAIGLVIIACSYIAAGLIGVVFFDDASFIINPVFRSALEG